MTPTRTPGWLAAVVRVVGIVAVVCVVAVGCGSVRQSGQATSGSSVTSVSSVASSLPPTATESSAPPVTAAMLATDHWSELPAAPIAARENPVVAWTGTHVLVWGGASSDRNDATLYADGASYDPATQKWTTLPAAPLSARSDMGWVWTGTSLVIFGGEGGGANAGSSHALADGAIYSPASNSWRMLPKAPLSARFDPGLIWTGHEVLVIGGDPDNESLDGPGYVAGEAAYDPASNRWTTLPPMPMTPGHDVRHLRALATKRGVFVGELWQHITTTSDGGELDAGTDVAVYDPSGRTWSRLTTVAPTLDDQPAGLDGATVAGDRILVLPGQGWHGDGSLRPPSFGEHGYQLDLTTNRWSRMLPGPIDQYDPVGVWTGAALLEYDATVEMSLDSGPTTGPGESAAFDPSTSTWVSLPTATPSPRGDNAVWAGDRLIEWGLVGLSFGPS